MEKQTIEVKKGCDFFGEGGETIETIKRKVWAEAFGNFSPIFCRYKGNRELVKSKSGDISDPFRRDESYLSSLFISIK
jgi:hypothetical protein